MGGFTTDSGSWADIATKGKLVIDYCFSSGRATERFRLSGGVGYAGSHLKLIIVIYERGSAFDRALSGGIGPGALVGLDEKPITVNLSASGQSGNLSQV